MANTRKLSTQLGRGRSDAKQRGAVLVEAAIALPMVTLLLFGILEYGLLFSDGMKLASALRSGARAGAAMDGSAATNDYLILQSLKAASGKVAPEIYRVVVYKSDSVSGDVPTDCKNGVAILNVCNVYTQDDLNLSAAQLAGTGHSNPWKPGSRIPGTDYLGVWAGADHHWITGLFGDGRNVGDQAVMRVQPLPVAGGGSDSAFWPAPMATVLPTTTTTTEDPALVEPPPADPGIPIGTPDTTDPGPPVTSPPKKPAAPPPF